MATSPQQSIPKEQFLTIAVNLLHRQFIEAARTEAKRHFKEIAEGRELAITNLQMEDNSTILFVASLDHSEFDGELRFSTFRAGLSNLLANLTVALQEQQTVPVFSREDKSGSILFGVSGVAVQNERVSVLALGADLEERPGSVALRLMYLDPSQLTSGSAENPTGQPPS